MQTFFMLTKEILDALKKKRGQRKKAEAEIILMATIFQWQQHLNGKTILTVAMP